MRASWRLVARVLALFLLASAIALASPTLAVAALALSLVSFVTHSRAPVKGVAWGRWTLRLLALGLLVAAVVLVLSHTSFTFIHLAHRSAQACPTAWHWWLNPPTRMIFTGVDGLTA
jgi:hypothetical protein